MGNTIICNLDEVLVTPRIVQLTEKTTGVKREIDVTNIPSSIILELIRRESDLKQKAASADETLFDWMMDITVKICKPSFPEITVDWIINNMNFNQLQKFLQFVLQPLNDYIQEAVEEAKNSLAAKVKTQTLSKPRNQKKK